MKSRFNLAKVLSIAFHAEEQQQQQQQQQQQTPPKTFTQDEVNAILARERRTQSEKLESQLKDAKTTAEQKTLLEQQLEELRAASMTEKERAAAAMEKAKKDSEAQITQLTGDRDGWRNRYQTSLIDGSLTSASVEHDAFNPKQIIALLKSSARVVETLDAEGKPTGQYGVKVKVNTVNSKGEPVELDLNPSEAVKTIKEIAEYGNLFKGKQKSGGGDGGGSGSQKQIDLTKLSHEDYMKLRKENPAALGLR